MGFMDWLLGTRTDSVKGHEVEYVQTGSAGQQVFGHYQCVECGEEHNTQKPVLWSNDCDGPPREDAWVTAPVGVYVKKNKMHDRIWGKLISGTEQTQIRIVYPRRYEEPELHETLTRFNEGDYLYAVLRGVNDMRYYQVEEFVNRDVVETIPNEELIVEIDTQAE